MNLYENSGYHHSTTFSSYILNDGNDKEMNNTVSSTMNDVHHNQPTLSVTGNSSSEEDDEKFDDDEYHDHPHIHENYQEKKLQKNHSHLSLSDKASTTTSIKNSHRHNNNSNKGNAGQSGNDRLFVCVLCERVFSRKEHAKRHCGKPKCIKKFIELAVEESAALNSNSINNGISDYTTISTKKATSSSSP
ncbi:hypothetical protein BDC45DRAFT_493137 [Circinella umbellata]|nr:hypothetical protein BDC45DRAFT_493137 [Circinella umbellata]